MHRHSYKTRKLGRKSAQRKALMRGLATSVILHERVKTTTAKAKEVQPIVEKLITVAKKGDLSAVRKLSGYLYGQNAVEKMMQEITLLYKDRSGGYTRIVKTGYRPGDAAPMAIIELVDADKLTKKLATVEPKAKKVEKKETVSQSKAPSTATKKTVSKKPAVKKEAK